jgi:NAD(P)-dependent dehydrogenase (short-subunit alcohol dehydrogenase family)
MPERETWLITGAGRGIGLAVAQAQLARGGRVYAGVRDHPSPELVALQSEHGDRLTCIALDVRDSEAVAKASRAVAGPIDVLFNNAAIFGPRGPSFRGQDYNGALGAFDVNALGVVRVVDAFLPHMAGAERPRIVAVSSLMGALSRPGSGDLAYRASKAALNKIMQIIAAELQPQKIAVACLRPGWVRTRMGGDNAPMSPAESATQLLAVVDRLEFNPSALFLDITGEQLQW